MRYTNRHFTYLLTYTRASVLVHPALKEPNWVTRFLQLLLSSAASSTSSQLMPIFLRSFLTTSFQFCRGRPGLLLKPSCSHVRACHRSLWWSIPERCPIQLNLIMSSSSKPNYSALSPSSTIWYQHRRLAMPCNWEGNHMSGVAMAIYHRQVAYPPTGSGMND